MLEKSESMNLVTSCNQKASVVLNTQVGKVWDSLRSFNWSQIFPSHVKSLKFTSGGPNEVGSTFDINYVDGSLWSYRMIEISENNRSFTYELVSANPKTSFSSMQNHLKLSKISYDDTTYFEWLTEFSNDVNSHVIEDNKFKKMDHFRDLKKIFN